MKLSCKIPEKVYLAYSGGMDSSFALHFLLEGRRDVECIYVNHRTPSANTFEYFVRANCSILGVKLHCQTIDKLPKEEQTEKGWRDERYKIFGNFADRPIVTAHHFDDAFESFLMGRTIAAERDNFLRPFLLWDKKEIVEYVERHSVRYIDDPTNKQNTCTRNKLRNGVIPDLRKAGTPLFNKLMAKLLGEKIEDHQ